VPHSRLRQISPWDKLAAGHIERLFLPHASICHTSIFPTIQFGATPTAQVGAPQDSINHFFSSLVQEPMDLRMNGVASVIDPGGWDVNDNTAGAVLSFRLYISAFF